MSSRVLTGLEPKYGYGKKWRAATDQAQNSWPYTLQIQESIHFFRSRTNNENFPKNKHSKIPIESLSLNILAISPLASHQWNRPVLCSDVVFRWHCSFFLIRRGGITVNTTDSQSKHEHTHALDRSKLCVFRHRNQK